MIGRRPLPMRATGAVTASALLATALSVTPVLGGEQRAAAKPVAPEVSSRPLKDLSPARVAPHEGGVPDHVLTLATGPGDATVVGLTWPGSSAPAAGTEVEVRGRTAAGWTAWTHTEVESEEDPAATRAGLTARAGTEPVWLGPDVSSVQVRYPDRVADQVRPARLELVDPGRSAADAVVGGPAAAARATTAMPRVRSRKEWGADESLRTCAPVIGRTTSALVVHHTVGNNSYTASQSAALVRGIYAFHTRSRGWCDIGYNALVDKHGQVFEGRAGGINLPVVGAHATGFNTDTFGVSVLGTHSSTSPSSATRTALAKLLAWRAASWYRNPLSTTRLTSGSSASRYRAGTVVTKPFVIGHRDVGLTECPGGSLYAVLPSLRSAVATRTSYTKSPIYARWVRLGAESGSLGPVHRGEEAVTFGRRTVFQGGWALYSVGASTRLVSPLTDRAYQSAGGPKAWGAPLSDEKAVIGGYRLDFANGRTVLRSSATGAAAVIAGMRRYWMATGQGRSPLGFPTAAERRLASGGASQTFRGGNAYWKPRIGVHGVHGAILTSYTRLGGPSSRLGYPTSERVVRPTGTTQRFEHGSILAPADGRTPTVTYS